MVRIPGVLAVISVLALTAGLAACTPEPGTGGPGGSGASTPAADPRGADAGADDTGCFSGEWAADINELAAQLGASLTDSGLAVVSSTGAGTQELSVDQEGYLGIAVDMTFTIVIDMSDGLVMQVDQHQTGQAGADWAWDASSDEASGTIAFSNFNDSEYHVDTTVSINGQAGDSSVPIDASALADVPMHVECSGDTMVTTQAPSPFHTTWHRVG